MKKLFLLITTLHLLGINCQIRRDYIIKGNDSFDESDVRYYEFNFGSNWRGPEGSEGCMKFEYEIQFGEPGETFFFIPPGETTPLEIIFQTGPRDFNELPYIFDLERPQTDARVCDQVVKKIPGNIICVPQGNSACNGMYRYLVTVGSDYDEAFSNIEFIGGLAPQLIVDAAVNVEGSNSFSGRLGATFQVETNGADTVRIDATDFQGEPRGNIEWRFIAQGTSNEISLPGSLVGATVTGSQEDSSLTVSGITTVHLGEYIAIATNEHGSDRASAFITRGVGPFIIEESGQASSNSFRVGADRAVAGGEEIEIRAEDRLSDPSSTITWSYSRSESGPYSAISSGGSYRIDSSVGADNVGRDSLLRIINVQPDQFGYYRAEAVNEFGTHTSTTSLIGRQPTLALGAGLVAGGSGEIGNTFDSASGTITIRAFDINGFPDSTYTWQRTSPTGTVQQITTGGRYRITNSVSGGRPVSTLTITGVTVNELGTYTVEASNVFGDVVGESLVGTGSTCSSGSDIVRVINQGQYESGSYFDTTTNVNRFTIIASDQSGVPHGTSSFSYSRTPTGSRSAVDTAYAITATPIGAPGTIEFFNLVDGAYGYYYAQLANQFGDSECSNLVGAQLVFRTGSGQIGQNYQLRAGDSLSISAQFSDGFPVGEIIWRGPNGQIITPTTPGYTIGQGLGSSILVINSARDGTDYGQYTASSSNVFGQVTRSSTVSQTMDTVAPTIDAGSSDTVNTGGTGRIGESFQASSGETVTIRANDITGVEASDFRWCRIAPDETQCQDITNNPAYTISTVQNPSGLSDSTLTFQVGADTYGTYRAEAMNSAGTDAAISQVGQPPRVIDRFNLITISAGSSRTVPVGAQIGVAESGSVTLTATDVDGQPGRQFVWTYRNDPDGPFLPLPANRITESVDGNVGSLIINSIDRSQYGEYRVIATNQFGESTPVTTVVGGPPIIRFSSGVETDGEGEIGNNFIIPSNRRLRITACIIGGYPPADPDDFRFEEEGSELESVQQLPPNDNCFIYEEGEFEIICSTTITARTENTFGSSNQPSSEITFPSPLIVTGSSTCNQGNIVTSVQIGSDLCINSQTSFDITCSVENVQIPAFSYEWRFNGNPITTGVTQDSAAMSILSISAGSVDDSGRYTCTVQSVCGNTDTASTDVDVFEYMYVCNQNDLIACSGSRNGRSFVTVSISICDGLPLERPVCSRCNWEMSQWSVCSDPDCHRGRRTRTVQCNCEGEITVDTRCLLRSPRPDGILKCGPAGVRCNRPFTWKAYQFGTCSRTCGDSIRSRKVECVSTITGNGVSDSECFALSKPSETISCFTQPCDSCVNRLSDSDCRIFIDIVEGCNYPAFNVRYECCQTCSDMGL
ncbi:ADAMTS-like protein 2 [Oopsacas minuta]|uniref:ADAMTS-like protein 2 n=1 Tax=Oopsacas minuta TaxID=111878 RepID=A0AAV7JWQ1_9METZ|nr:ADAMTS-like protein 2 [Oopsacas minuta]